MAVTFDQLVSWGVYLLDLDGPLPSKIVGDLDNPDYAETVQWLRGFSESAEEYDMFDDWLSGRVEEDGVVIVQDDVPYVRWVSDTRG